MVCLFRNLKSQPYGPYPVAIPTELFLLLLSGSCKYVRESGTGKGKVVPVFNLIKHYAMKAYGGVDV
jgi:hypothetical protein